MSEPARKGGAQPGAGRPRSSELRMISVKLAQAEIDEREALRAERGTTWRDVVQAGLRALRAQR